MELILTSGSGPLECAYAVGLVASLFEKEALAFGLKVEIRHRSEVIGTQPRAFRSIVLSLVGKSSQEFLNNWLGTILWNGESPYRPGHKRKNWFIGVAQVEQPQLVETTGKIELTSMRASGPGGQNVNKTNSAVRAVHLDSGYSVSSRETRSQVQNRKLAEQKIKKHLSNKNEMKIESFEKEKWTAHWTVERGQPTRTFHGVQLRERKRDM